MGYVTVTESFGEVMKTYHFSSYDDFKDWENKISGIVVSADEVTLHGDIWITNTGVYPPIGLNETDRVAVKFASGMVDEGGIVMDYFGWNSERKDYWRVSGEDAKDFHITHYRKLS